MFDEFGGPEVTHVAVEPLVEPSAAEVRIRIEAFAARVPTIPSVRLVDAIDLIRRRLGVCAAPI